jgi:peptide deformylase
VTARPLVLYPDPRLKQPAEPVRDFDDTLRTLIADIVDTMRAAPAVGLTAVHIGVLKRVVVLLLPSPADAVPDVFINPEIVTASPETARHTEGSVSMPGMSETVERPARITLRYQTPDGTLRETEAEGFRAACLQHEIDQLDGIFWIDRLSRLKRDRLLKRFGKQAR